MSGILADPIAQCDLEEFNNCLASFAFDLCHGEVVDERVDSTVSTLCSLSRDIRFHIGPMQHAEYNQANFAKASFIAAADVLEYACQGRNFEDLAKSYIENIRDRAARMEEGLKQNPQVVD